MRNKVPMVSFKKGRPGMLLHRHRQWWRFLM